MPLLWKFMGALLKYENICLFKQNISLNKISATMVPYSMMTLHTGIPIVPYTPFYSENRKVKDILIGIT